MWGLTTLLEGKKLISVKWVYKANYNSKGEVDHFKAGLVVKGYKQKHDIEYFKNVAPFDRMDTICMILPSVPKVNGRYLKWM